MAQKFAAPFDPQERKDYVRDWSEELTPLEDEIQTVTFTLPAAALTAGMVVDFTQISADKKKAIVWIKSNDPTATTALANDDTDIEINHHIITVAGREYDETLILKIRNK